MADLAFAQALLQGEGIAVFEMDVNMSVLEGGIGIFPRRLMVVEADYDRGLQRHCGTTGWTSMSIPDLTHDAFLGGRLKLWQPKQGYRAGV